MLCAARGKICCHCEMAKGIKRCIEVESHSFYPINETFPHRAVYLSTAFKHEIIGDIK
jgi:hypothetical protein